MALLAAEKLMKRYTGVAALSEVAFELRDGEVHALVGENGAGKSTLCRILCGITPPDEGSMTLRGASYSPRSRRAAEHAGVRMVMQELNLLPTLTVAENIYIDVMPRRLGVVRYRAMNAAAQRAIDAVGLTNVRPNQLVSTLGVGQQQLVEIAAALSRKCQALVLDEPTAALTSPEIELLFAQIRRLKANGVGIIYVSHRMEEIRAISDRITVLRDGKWIATRPTAELSHDETVRLMVGRDLSAVIAREKTVQHEPGEVALSVRGLSRGLVKEVSFDARRGEILGFAGLMGSGRTETMRAIFGADRRDSGEIHVARARTRGKAPGFARRVLRTPRDAVRRGIALLTEDRKSQGLLLPLDIATNTSLPRISAVTRFKTWISRRRENDVALRYINTLSIRCRSPRQRVKELSGGNQQKIVLAKWLLRDCDVLIFDEPTRGIDVGAKFEIYRLLAELAERGKAVIVVSSDLLELTAIADRIAVMSAGRLVKTFNRGEWTQELIMEAALSGYRNRSVAEAAGA